MSASVKTEQDDWELATYEEAMYTSLNRILDEWFEDPKVREEFEEWKKERSGATAK